MTGARRPHRHRLDEPRHRLPRPRPGAQRIEGRTIDVDDDHLQVGWCGPTQPLVAGGMECIHRIYGYGMFVTAGFIVGFDTEKASMGQPMIDFIEEANIQVCMVGLLYALPGIADAAIGQGRPPAQRP
jgi:hypothetical protein